MNHFEVTAILHNFSSSNNNSKWKKYVDERTGNVPLWYYPLFYANGNCRENAGYVSIIFSLGQLEYLLSKITEIRCHVSVVDVAGNKRFTQSVVCVPDNINPGDLEKGLKFGLERYIKRETLLNDPDELLPDDCLTLYVDVDVINCIFRPMFSNLFDRKEYPLCRDGGGRLYISLDSDFGRELCRMSEVFRCASDSHFIEGRTRIMLIQKEEEDPFMHIFKFFKGLKQLTVGSIADLFHLYHVADKYDLQSVIQTCRQVIKALLCTTDDLDVVEHVAQSVHEILELADTFRDSDLKDAVQTYIKSKDNFSKNYYELGKHLKQELSTEWNWCKTDLGYSISRLINQTTQDDRFLIASRTTELEFEFYQ